MPNRDQLAGSLPGNFLLLLALPLWFLLVMASLRLSYGIASFIIHGSPLAGNLIWPSSIAPGLIYFPLLVGTVAPAMVLVNYFVYYCVPPARRAMEAEEKRVPGTEYGAQQPVLVRISMLTLPAAFVLAVIGRLFL